MNADYINKIINKVMIVPRHDTLENWLKYNPIPKLNELCCVLTKRGNCKWKLGDGKTSFKKLKYIHRIPPHIVFYNATVEASGSEITNKYLKNTIVHFNPFMIDDEQ